MRSGRVVVVVFLLVGLAAPRALAAPTPLQTALELYAAASYDEALAALDTVGATDLSVDEQVVVAQHRMLCLMAMGRTADAERAAASLLALRPEFVLGVRDASPRVRTMFETARRRVLPAVVRERFAAGRRLYDRGALPEACTVFASVAAALADAAVVAPDPALADLRTLAEGFLALTTVAAARVESAAPPTAPAAPAPPSPTLIVDESSALVSFPTDSAVALRDGDRPADPPASDVAAPVVPATEELAPVPHPSAAAMSVPDTSIAAPAGAPFTPIDIFTYDWRDKDVTPPVPVVQAVSGWWGSMGEPPAGTPLGAVAVVIDEHGTVVDATIHQSVNRVYDAVLLASVRQWRYQPATRGGRPVKYRRISGVVSGR